MPHANICTYASWCHCRSHNDTCHVLILYLFYISFFMCHNHGTYCKCVSTNNIIIIIIIIILSSTFKTSLFGLFPDGETFVKKVEILDWLFIITLRYLNLFFINMCKFPAKFIWPLRSTNQICCSKCWMWIDQSKIFYLLSMDNFVYFRYRYNPWINLKWLNIEPRSMHEQETEDQIITLTGDHFINWQLIHQEILSEKVQM